MTDYVRVNLWNESISYGQDLGDGSLVGAIAKLNELAAKVPSDRLTSVRFEFEDDGYESEDYRLKIWYERPKTTEEIETERIERENNARSHAERREREERALYDALKSKYEDG